MITTHRLSDAQAAVLSGDVEWNANGSCAVTTGRENTLASLRKLGLLNGRLLTGNGNNARVSVQGGERKITISEDGEATFYAAPVRADWETDGSANQEPHHYCPNCTQTHPTEDAELHAAPCFVCASDGHAGCQHGDDAPETDDAPTLADMTHMIQFTGADMSLCGILVKSPMRPGFVLRVSVDPSDATCPDCIAQEAELAALDAVQPDDDAQDHREAIKDAQAAETAAQATPGYPRQTADGRTVWACCESSIGAPCQHRTGARDAGDLMVVIEPSRTDRRKVVAWLVGLNASLRREFRADRSMTLHVAFWAQAHGVRPADGRKFKWQKHETLSLAPARF